AGAAIRLGRVHLALHHVELAIHRQQAPFRFDDDQAVHAVGNVVRHARHGAVIDVYAGITRLEGEDALFAGRGLGQTAAAVRSGHSVQVDGMGELATVLVLYAQLDSVTF